MFKCPNFNNLQLEFFKDKKSIKKQTLCLDIINTIIIKEDINDHDLLE
jgi:hypothetical protein